MEIHEKKLAEELGVCYITRASVPECVFLHLSESRRNVLNARGVAKRPNVVIVDASDCMKLCHHSINPMKK